MTEKKKNTSAEHSRSIPELRFPEFDEEWILNPIRKYIDLLSGYAFKGEEISENQNGIAILRGINISEGFIRHNKEIDRYYCGNVNNLTKYLLQEKDLVLGMDGSKVGRNSAIISKNEAGSILIQRVARIRAYQTADIMFIYFHINSKKFHRYVDIVNTSSGIPHISSDQIKDFSFYFPPLSEQQKIASFLTSVDERIQQLTKKKELLEKYKKGIMQKIFSQQIRFKDDDGKDFPAWEEKKLRDIGATFNGLSGKSADDFGSGFPYVTYKQIFDNSRIDITKFALVVVEKDEKQSNVKYGDVFFTTSSETQNEVGYSSVLLDNVDKVFLNSFCFGFRLKSFQECNPNFAQFLFRTQKFRKEMYRLSQGSTRYNLSKTEFLKTTLLIPNIEEQQKIADFLSSIDKKIEEVEKQLEKTKEFKKGLLQKMFV